MASRTHLWCALLFFFSPLILYLERRTLLGPTLPAIVQPSRGNVGMPQPFLHFGNVGIVRKGIGGSGGT